MTPVAALMFRFNNPDALLVLLLVAAAYCVVRAIETASTKWMALAGCAIGFAFLAKLLQAFLVAPGLALAFLVAAPVGLWQRIWKLMIGAAALIASGGWYLALVSLWPADSRPYIGGSTDNSLVQLTLGYNGLQRVLGGEGPGGGGHNAGPPPGGGSGDGPAGMGHLFFGGDPGIGRMFGMSMGTEASWLLPAALIGLVAGLWLTRKSARTDRVRASLLLWGGWLLVTAAVFSFMDGIIHPYYTVALAPAIAALVGISVRELWRVREHLGARLVLAVMSAGTGVWAFVLLDRTPDWLPALRWIVLAGSVVLAVMLAVGAHRRRSSGRGIGSGRNPFRRSGARRLRRRDGCDRTQRAHLHVGSEQGRHVRGPQDQVVPAVPGGHGGPGGRIAENAALAEMVQGLDNRWAAAAIGSMGASGLELKTGASIMAIGGFTGSDDSPTLEQFQGYVADHEVRYFIAGEPFGPPGRHESGAASEITYVGGEEFQADQGRRHHGLRPQRARHLTVTTRDPFRDSREESG